MTSNRQAASSDDSWKVRFLAGGAVIGALLGGATAYLLVRTAEESDSGPPKVSTSDAIRASVGVIGVVRGIAALGNNKKK